MYFVQSITLQYLRYVKVRIKLRISLQMFDVNGKLDRYVYPHPIRFTYGFQCTLRKL